jgi:enamine deaminase RidA (YjgF/YER057c/UK114 family)
MAASSDRQDVRWSRRDALGVAGAGVAVSALGASPAAAQSKQAKEVANFGMPWEEQYGYAQAVKVGDTIYVSGQLSHDDQGNMVAPAPLDSAGRIADHGNMGAQMAQSYANIKKVLASFGATMDDIVEEVVRHRHGCGIRGGGHGPEGGLRRTSRGHQHDSGDARLAFADQLIEVKVTAKV